MIGFPVVFLIHDIEEIIYQRGWMLDHYEEYAVANITGDVSTLQVRGSAGMSDNLKLIINARVETSPEQLDEIVKQVLVDAIGDKYQDEILAWRYLMPGRPNPTHRIV